MLSVLSAFFCLFAFFVGRRIEADTVDHLEKDTVLVAFNSTILPWCYLN